jgi:zinc/manganese transport system permease protein
LSTLDILTPPLAFMALMLFTHTYLGLHVLMRGVIFVDLALAQIAALGASIAFTYGAEPGDPWALGAALGAAILAAAGFAQVSRIQDNTVREVIIGIVYVIATALSVLVLSQSTTGMEHLKLILNGSVLLVSWADIAVAAVAYGVISIGYGLFSERLIGMSQSRGVDRHSIYWEAFFFSTFAIIITIAVGVAGVLLVFAFLIVPAFAASLIAVTFRGRLLLAWLGGASGSIAGLLIAFYLDLPIGPTVVATLGLLPILAAVWRFHPGKKSTDRSGA